MRKVLIGIVVACMALLLAPTAADARPATRLKIEHATSAFYLYDGSVSGTGPQLDAVMVHAQLRNCAAGDYLLEMSLVQDGVSYPIASTALGVGEVTCTAANTARTVSMGFYGNSLHPGSAQVTATFYRQADGMPVAARDSRTVIIPNGPNQP